VTTTMTTETSVDAFIESNGNMWTERDLTTDATLSVRRVTNGILQSMLFKDATTIQLGQSSVRMDARGTTEWMKRADGRWSVQCLSGVSQKVRVASGTNVRIDYDAKAPFIVD
jgi:hypothetical protein